MKNKTAKNLQIDILILAMKNPERLLDFFKNYDINHIIYFNFNQPNSNFKLKRIQDMAINLFSLKFVSNMVDDDTIEQAFQHSKGIMLKELFNEGLIAENDQNKFEKTIGKGPLMYSKYGKSEILLMVTESNFLKFMPGKLNETSSNKGPINIHRISKLLTDRNEDIYFILRYLVENKWSVNLHG